MKVLEKLPSDCFLSGAIIIAFIAEVARGHDGPYLWLGAIGGLAYLIAVVALRMRG